MRLRLFVASLLCLAMTAPAALAHDTILTAADRWRSFDAHHGVGVKAFAAQAAAPLTGTGSNLELVANHPIGEASDLELHGNLAFVGSYTEGMAIVDIGNPKAPKRVGTFKCGGGSQYDIQLRPDGKVALITTDGSGSSCHNGSQGSMVVDVSDPANPKELSYIEVRNPGSGGTIVGSHTHTLDWPYLYINQYQTSYHRVEVFSLVDPAKPVKIGELDFGADQPAFHDSFVDHRPDGKTYLYAGSASANDVIDVTDPSKPKLVQRTVDPEVSFSHQNEPDFDRNTALVTDEYLGGAAGPSCGKTSDAGDELPSLPEVGNPSDLGALHLYAIGADGKMGEKLSTFNLPSQPNNDPQNGCTIHVFWQAPDQDRLVTAWYGRGIRVLDYSNPRAVKELGNFIPTGTNVWAAKPHNGYIYTGDLSRGLDVLRYTGEGAGKWPATAGAAEAQRAAQQRNYRGPGAAPAIPGGSSSRPPITTPFGGGGGKATAPATAGGSSGAAARGLRVVTLRVRVPGRGTKRLTLRLLNTRGRTVGVLRTRARGGRRATIRARIAGLPGRYRYRLQSGKRTLKRGRITVKAQPGLSVRLPKGRSVVITSTR
jgi:hypothetical protein